MKTNMKNRPVGWTTLEEAQELVRVGLDPGTADMWWAPDADTVIPTPYITKTDDETLIPAYKGAVPCWSLGALMELMPEIDNQLPSLRKCKNYYCVVYSDIATRLGDNQWQNGKTSTEAAYNMVCWLLKEGYLNPKS